MSFKEFRRGTVTFVLLAVVFGHIPSINGRPLNEPHRRFPEVPRSEEDVEDAMMTGMPGMPENTGMPGMPEHTGMPGMPEHTGMPGMPEMDMGMMMYFHKSEHATILFEKWHTMTWQEMLGSCIGLAIIAALYEGFKVAREVINTQQQRKRKSSGSPVTGTDNKGFLPNGNYNHSNNIGFDDGHVDDGCCNPKCGMCSGWHWLQTFLHVIQVFVSYCLMLVFMTYNAWLCIAVCIGAGIGYFFFGWLKHNIQDPNEHCH